MFLSVIYGIRIIRIVNTNSQTQQPCWVKTQHDLRSYNG